MPIESMFNIHCFVKNKMKNIESLQITEKKGKHYFQVRIIYVNMQAFIATPFLSMAMMAVSITVSSLARFELNGISSKSTGTSKDEHK